MSVQNESLEMKNSERKTSAPELEYKAASQDSLSMFFAAIGGAVLGMLATLLVLALINGGTLNFTHPERLAVMEASLARVNENVGAVSQNLDTVATQVTDVRDQMASARSEVDTALTQLEQQGASIGDVQSAVTTSVALPPITTAGTTPNQAAVTPDSNSPSSLEAPMKTALTPRVAMASSGQVDA